MPSSSSLSPTINFLFLEAPTGIILVSSRDILKLSRWSRSLSWLLRTEGSLANGRTAASFVLPALVPSMRHREISYANLARGLLAATKNLVFGAIAYSFSLAFQTWVSTSDSPFLIRLSYGSSPLIASVVSLMAFGRLPIKKKSNSNLFPKLA